MSKCIFIATDAAGLHSDLERRLNERLERLRSEQEPGARCCVESISLVGDARLLVVVVAVRVSVPAWHRVARSLNKFFNRKF